MYEESAWRERGKFSAAKVGIGEMGEEMGVSGGDIFSHNDDPEGSSPATCSPVGGSGQLRRLMAQVDKDFHGVIIAFRRSRAASLTSSSSTSGPTKSIAMSLDPPRGNKVT